MCRHYDVSGTPGSPCGRRPSVTGSAEQHVGGIGVAVDQATIARTAEDAVAAVVPRGVVIAVPAWDAVSVVVDIPSVERYPLRLAPVV
jgi:hypothetical protein